MSSFIMKPRDLSLKPTGSRTKLFVVLLPKFSSIRIHETNLNGQFSLME